MFKTYLKQIISSIRKASVSTLINIAGLSIGIAVFLLIMSYVLSELNVNKDITNYYRIYRISKGDGTGYQGTPARLGEIINNSIPQLGAFTRVDPAGTNHVIKIDGVPEKTGSMVYVDSSFFRIFNLPFKYGDPKTCLDETFSMVITESVSSRLFPGENPVGDVLRLDGKYNVKISGVVFDPGSKTHITGDMFLSFHSMPVMRNWPGLFDCHTCYNYETYLMFSHDINREGMIKRINESIDEYGRKYSIESMIEDSYTLTDLDGVYFGEEERPSFRKGNKLLLRLLASVGVLIIVIALINYINLSAVHGSTLIHQMALRKVLGAKKHNLYLPVLAEAVLISLFSTGLALLIVKLTAPVFGAILNFTPEINLFDKMGLAVMLVLFSLIIGLIAGFWPAILLTKFDTGKSIHLAIHDKLSGGRIRRILTVFQVVVSVALIGCTAVVYTQLKYIDNTDLGFDREILVYLPVNNEILSRKDAFRNEMVKHPGIESASYSYGSYRTSNERWGFKYNDMDALIHIEAVDEHYLKTLGLNLIEGRNFRGSQDKGKLIVNQRALQKYFGENPVGLRVESLREDAVIIGVVEDFRFLTFDREVEPIGLIYRPDWSNICNIRLLGMNTASALSHMEETWNDFCLEYPFEYHFVDKLYKDRYLKERNMAILMAFFSLVSVVIAVMGLYGLSVYSVVRRAKEIGIRKVTGASLKDVIKSLTSDLNRINLISVVPAWLIIYFLMNKWLSGFAYHINTPVWVFPVSAFIVWLLATVSTIGKTIRTARINPAEILRDE